jgi:hypothetical protein
MKIWIDDIRPAPIGYIWVKTVNKAKSIIAKMENENRRIKEESWGLKFPLTELEVIDMDHDAGDYVSEGGDYIKLLDWLEATGRNFPIRIHSMNLVGVENMRRIIEKNGWLEIK